VLQDIGCTVGRWGLLEVVEALGLVCYCGTSWLGGPWLMTFIHIQAGGVRHLEKQGLCVWGVGFIQLTQYY